MRRWHLLRRTAMVAVVAVVAAGCGTDAEPVLGTQDEVLDAVMAVRDGAQARATAGLEIDRDEVRDVLRDDPEARQLLSEAVDGGAAQDADALVAELERARDGLADHALLLATGADGSARIAAEYRSTVWADLRVRPGPGDGDPGDGDDDDPAAGGRIDLQLQVDWATAAEVAEQPDLLGELDEAAAQIAPFLDDMPELAGVQKLLVAFLGGELVGIGGEISPDMLGGLGLSGQELSGLTGAGVVLAPEDLGLNHRDLAAAAFSFDGYRRDGETTLVDVTLELREVGELVLDRLAAAPDAMGLSFADVEEARTRLEELPDRLVNVATLHLDPAGTLQQVRVDVLDALLQVAQATDPDDTDVATLGRVVGQLDATGLFLVIDVDSIGQTTTVMGDPSATVTPDELAAAFGALLFGALGGGLDAGALDLEGQFPDDAATSDD